MTKRGWIFLVVWVLSLVIISNFGGTLSYGFFFAVTLLPVVCILYIVAVVAGFRIYQNLGSRNVVAGQPVEYYFVLQNEMPYAFAGLRVRLFSGLFEVAKVPDDREYELLPGENYRFSTKLFCKYRGEYEVGVESVIITDFLRLFRWKYTLPGTIKAIVSPRVVTPERLKSMEELPVSYSGRSLKGDAEPDVVVRDYLPGDSLKRVHWKNTAKTGELKVRLTKDEEREGIRLYFHGKRYSNEPTSFLPLENRILELVLAIASSLCRRQIPLRVDYGTDRGAVSLPVRDGTDFETLYGCMEEYSFLTELAEEAVTDFLGDCLREPPRVTFLVLAELTERILEATERLTDEGGCVVIYLVEQGKITDVRELTSKRRSIIPVGTEEDLENLL